MTWLEEPESWGGWRLRAEGRPTVLVRREGHPRAEVQRAQPGAGSGAWNTAPGPPASPLLVSLCPEGPQSLSQARFGNIWLIPKPSLPNLVLADILPFPWWGRQLPLGPTCPPTPLPLMSHAPVLHWERPGGRLSQVPSKSDTLTNQEPHLLGQLSLHNRQKAGSICWVLAPEVVAVLAPRAWSTSAYLCQGAHFTGLQPPGL